MAQGMIQMLGRFSRDSCCADCCLTCSAEVACRCLSVEKACTRILAHSASLLHATVRRGVHRSYRPCSGRGMQYGRAVAVVRYMTDLLSELAGELQG